MAHDPSQRDPSTLHRRDFLKLGATGVAVSMAGAAPLDARPPTHGGPPQQASQAPSADDVMDPKQVPVETWQEPWIWRPGDWPGDHLELNVIRNQNPGPSTSPGVEIPTLYSYGGMSPAPTIRARGDEAVAVRLRNHMGLDRQMTPVGPCPDLVDILPHDRREVCKLVWAADGTEVEDPETARCPGFIGFFRPEETFQHLPVRRVPGYANLSHTNGQRTAHVTNIHTHGLHVPPNHNPDGSLSDHVLLRVIPRADWQARQDSGDADLMRLREYERVSAADYRFLLGEARHGAPDGAPAQPHPPGTHWYHPHSHGSTHDQVASGMAGFFIVEGDVDDAVNLHMTGTQRPDPTERTGPYDYRERVMLVQRVFVNSLDLDAGPRRNDLRFPPLTAVNGTRDPSVILMRPGAVERWRALNGSVDGSGFKRLMVLEGQFVSERNRLWRVVEEEVPPESDEEGREPEIRRRLEAVTEQEVEDAKLPLHLLAFDGITLVAEENGQVRHVVRDLSEVGKGTPNPMAQPARGDEDRARTMLRNIEDCYRDGDSLRRAYNRPNEVYMGPANRADLFFKAPLDADGRVFTVIAREDHLSSDKTQSQLQTTLLRGRPFIPRTILDVVVAYVRVRGEPVEGGDFDVASVGAVLPDVPAFLMPVREDELQVGAEEARRRNVPAGSRRTRVVSYSGTGGADWPLLEVPQAFADAHPELESIVWGRHDDTLVLLPNYTRTMAINPDFDLAANPEPPLPRKFMMDDPERVRTLVNTAEEWALYNCSLALWSQTDTDKLPQPGQWGLHWKAFPLSRAEGQPMFREDHGFRITTKGVDHPFHIHINPMWVLRIDVPDENGTLHNILPEPRWMDTVPIPRNGGRVVYRTRFLDFTGLWVNHCHLLLHEDNGMMAVMECTDAVEEANYHPRSQVATEHMSADEVDRIYPRPSTELMYRQNLSFVDPSPETGQVYPGFELSVPQLPAVNED
jgi:FtsP/CotA-like multicopper oxidase with cupredoxin domain